MLERIKKTVNIVMQEAKESKSTSVKCNHCRLMLPLEDYPNRKRGTGKTVNCIKCTEKHTKMLRERQSRSAEEIKEYQLEYYPNGLYKCFTCNKEKPFVAFPTHKANNFGIDASCKECAAEKAKKRKSLPKGTEPTKCVKCEQVKPGSDFNKTVRFASGIDSHCSTCRALHRRASRDNVKAERNKIKSGGCTQCGFDNVLAMQFAHYKRGTKHRSPNGNAITPSILTTKLLKKELEFMRVLCANCHRLETFNEQKSNYSQKQNAISMRKTMIAYRQIIINEKIKRGHCLHCEKKVREDICCVFDFDHRNPNEKITNVSAMQSYSYTFKQIEDEMKKCDLLCANCHQIKSQIVIQKLGPATIQPPSISPSTTIQPPSIAIQPPSISPSTTIQPPSISSSIAIQLPSISPSIAIQPPSIAIQPPSISPSIAIQPPSDDRTSKIST